MQLIGRAMAIIEAFEAGPSQLTLAEISRRSQLNRSTAYRILGTLIKFGLIERDARGHYQLGLRLFELGSLVQKRSGLRQVAMPHLKALAESEGVTAFLSVRDQDRAVCVDRIDRGPVTVTTYQVGETLPLYLGAAPLVLLASLPTTDQRRILRAVGKRMSDGLAVARVDVERALSDIVATGVAMSDQDVSLGIAALGTAIHDPQGETIAAISISGLSQTLLGERRAQAVAALESCAHAIDLDMANGGGTIR